jgi:hypothetical protein
MKRSESMIFFLIVAMMSAAACERDVGRTSGSGGGQVPSSQQGVSAQTSFDLADQNDDGAVSRDEASTVADLDFSAADADKNAALSRQEYATAMEKARPRG